MEILNDIISGILLNSFILQLIVNSGGRCRIDEKAYDYKPPSETILSPWGNTHLSDFMTVGQAYKYLPQWEHLIHPSVLANPDCLADCVDIWLQVEMRMKVSKSPSNFHISEFSTDVKCNLIND